MRVFREEDPMESGYTVLENDTLWVDLSCRALGLLVRWLSKPPGVEVDTIPDIITRARRRGNKRMEGRDALYTASYELEEEGYLVRRLFTNEKGQHEWAAFIRSRPVPPEERSHPDDRKRDTVKNKRAKKAAAAKPAAPSGGPNPGNPFSGPTCEDAASPQVNPNPGKPDSGGPNSENQASSYQSSLHSSLSGSAPAGEAEGRDEEREAATPKTDNRIPAQAAGEQLDDAGKIVAAYMAAWIQNTGRPPARQKLIQVRDDAEGLLSKGRTVKNLCELAADMANKGWSSLSQHAAMNPEAKTPQRPVLKDWCGVCNDGERPHSPAQRTLVDAEGRITKCECHPGYKPSSVPA